ncbi:phosphoribosylamine--glycine ligase [Flavobacteriaceae bacterium D16]|nr:phosphoribosylamine--glycine ligase [Flavobacteriaceae bacterium D16]
MNILILGSGGREHTFAWKIAQSNKLNKLFIAPGNAGTASLGDNLSISVNDFKAIKGAVLENEIGMVIVGPEDPLVNGIHDYFLNDPEIAHIPVIGPQQQAAQLEGSKEFAKAFMSRHNIPTAAYQSFTKDSLEEGYAFLETLSPPYVLKADGLAAGKGVLILDDLNEAKNELKAMLEDAKFGAASATVVIEEFLDGIELSCFVLTDGKDYKVLPTAKDYKRIGEGDTGLNTGGMGAISPVPFADESFMKKVRDQIVIPTVKGLQKEALPYKGFIFIGLINVDGAPKVIEYNVRMGDPETEVVLPRLKNDMISLMLAVSNGKLAEVELDIDERTATTVMAVSGGYPEAYKKGYTIEGIEETNGAVIFHAGTRFEDDKVVTNGGRVLAVTSFGVNHKEALASSYENLARINFKEMYYRKDIGFDL